MKFTKKLIILSIIFISMILQSTILITNVQANFFENTIRFITDNISVRNTNDDYTLDSIKRYYYNQLKNDLAKKTYNALVNSSSNTVTIDVSDLNLSTTETDRKTWFETYCHPYVNDGIEAYTLDSGNYWWQTRMNKWQGKFTTSSIDSNINVLNEIILTINEDIKYNNQTEFNNKLNEACNTISGNTVYEKVEAINKYICDNVEYGHVDGSHMYRTAYGALIEHKAVSEGYAELFNVMCRQKGIISLCVSGTVTNSRGETSNHVWNYVYEPSKKQWYAVDCTWNDEMNAFVMVGSDTVVKGLESMGTFGNTHKPEGYKAFENQTFSPTVPALSKEKYDAGQTEPEEPVEPENPQDGGNAISSNVYTIENNTIKYIQPNTKYSDFIKNIKSNASCTIKEGDALVTGEITIKTGQILTVGKENFTLIVSGDVNKDGKADLKDILAINKHRLNKITLSNPYFEAGDVNKDGKADIKDILQINKYRLGKTNKI